MRERAAAVGGGLRTGPAAGGGFLVEANLPAKAEAAVAFKNVRRVPDDVGVMDYLEVWVGGRAKRKRRWKSYWISGGS